MVLLNSSKLSKSFGIDNIFENISFTVDSKDKIGILGVNGAGKTTLFNILTGESEPDSGSIYKSSQLKICYVKQQLSCTSEKTVYEEVLEVFDYLRDLEKEIKHLRKEIEINPDEDLIQKLHNTNQLYIDEGGLTYESRISSALNGLGITTDMFDVKMNTLSGGQRTKVLLAKILLSKSDLLLLDEPTNHLDIQAVSWLENFLINYQGAILLITHDRYFLDKVTNKIFELENGKLKEYNGNYSYYRTKKDADRKAEEKDYALKEKEIKRIEGIIEQQKRWNREKNIKTAESKQKVIERIEATMVKPDKTLDSLNFKFNLAEECAKDVLTCENISKSFSDNKVLSNVNIEIKKGEKVFLLGENGCGKTTLFNIILEKLTKDSGKVKIGPRVKTAYYDQTQQNLNLSNNIFEEISDFLPALNNTDIRCALAIFLFKDEDVFKEISTLSGGERTRVALCKLMLSEANFLLLDEPTNHLDIPSKEALENALSKYNGTLFVISHDRYFINKIADKIYELTPNGEKCFDGNYDYYLSKRDNFIENVSIKKEKVNDFKQQKELESQKRKLRTKISRCEDEISILEKEIEDINKEISNPENSSIYTLLTELTNNLNEKEEALVRAMENWEDFNKELEEL